jgi:organic hydroperoxide reductase OsmC/OhrA
MQTSYSSHIVWTGNTGAGTADYESYARTWDISVPGKRVIHCSNDPLLGGDAGKMNPEDLLLSSLSACHMLWYLHYASDAGIMVLAYEDEPLGIGEVMPSGAGRFISAVLRPNIIVRADCDLNMAAELHGRIHSVCFIARSVNFPIAYEPVISVAQ